MELKGVISDFDTDGLFGIINADDGRLLLFNLRGTPPVLRKCFRVGIRVEFIEQESDAAMRAVALVPIGGADA
jgi:hypothetical protein